MKLYKNESYFEVQWINISFSEMMQILKLEAPAVIIQILLLCFRPASCLNTSLYVLMITIEKCFYFSWCIKFK